MYRTIDRIYDNARARKALDWQPTADFASILRSMAEGGDWRGPLARTVGCKGYHTETFDNGPYPVTETPC